MNSCTKELVKQYASNAIENLAYRMTKRLEEGKTTRVGKFAQPISKQEQEEILSELYKICDRIESEYA